MQKTILVSGANGQLGMELSQMASAHPSWRFIFTTREEFPLDDFDLINNFIDTHKPQYLVNCAAYTAVDRAEAEQDIAYTINATAPGVIASACQRNNCQLIHISTDYVFDGNGDRPYREDDITTPVNLYGDSKLRGEHLVMQNNPRSVVIRTAWVYSEFGKNFVRTMLRLMEERESINVVSDQYGTPTYAADLAEAIMKIIGVLDVENDSTGSSHAGIYHFSNEGKISWYDFAVAIRDISGLKCEVKPISTADYPTPAKRPSYSVLDKAKVSAEFKLSIKPWRESLEVCLKRINVV